MALIIKFDSKHGIAAPLYWRLNNFEQFGNREPNGSRIPAIARFRAYVSEDAFKAGKSFLDEMLIEFTPSSVNANLGEEAYAALKALDPSAATGGAIDEAETRLATAKANEAGTAAAVAAIPKGKDGSTVIGNAEVAKNERVAAAAALDAAKQAHAEAVKTRKIIKAAKDV